MNCYLCDRDMLFLPSWRGLFINEPAETVCGKCKAEFERIDGEVCVKCGAAGENLCNDCLHWETTEYAELIHSGKYLYRYNAAMQTYLHQFKFLQDVALAEVFAAEVRKTLIASKAVIVPIPMNSKKLTERTFSQVDCLLDAAGLHYMHLLEKSEAVQGKKTKAERMAADMLFKWNGKEVPEKIIIADDLYTTGTTMRHAAKALKRAGAKEVSLFSLIRS